MSNIPYADLGEASGENSRELEDPASFGTAQTGKNFDEDKLSEKGDAGVSEEFYASYQVIFCCMKTI